MNRYEPDRLNWRDGLVLILLVVITAMAVFASQCGCSGNTASIKPNNETDVKLKTSLKNQQEMKESIETLQGDLVKIQQSISTVVNTIITQIDQKFETFQESVSNKIGEVGRDVNTETNKSENSALYGIGLVAVVLIFVLAAIWLLARIFREAAVKVFKL